MSITTGDFRGKITASTLLEKKRKKDPIVCITAYDYAQARLADEAGVDFILVGDSVAQTTLGYENTLPVTVDEIAHHTRAVARGRQRAFLVADMPFGSYHVDDREALSNAVRFIKEAGAEAVKLEGGERRAQLVRRMVEAEIPVVGHIGLTPQSIHAMGGYKVQGKTPAALEQLIADAEALDAAGVCALVLEGVPREAAAIVTARVSTPTIGIGAGSDCDGQIIVLHDILGLTFHQPAKFVRRYADAASLITEAIASYSRDVRQHAYPNEAESYHLPKETLSNLPDLIGDKQASGE